MDVKLSPDLERKVHERVGDAYATPSDVVEEALRSFFGPDELTGPDIEDLNRRIDIGLAEIRRGETIEGAVAREASLDRLTARHRS